MTHHNALEVGGAISEWYYDRLVTHLRTTQLKYNMLVTVVLQQYYSIVAVVLQECYSSVKCYSCVTAVL